MKAGILTTLQGSGRRGYARFGINPGGAMDTTALRLLNIMLGNDEGEGALELHFPAGVFRAESECMAALGGADFGARLNSEFQPTWSPFTMRPGDTLEFNSPILGSRAYLAVAGGFDADEWLGSKSTDLATRMGGISGRAIGSGDLLITREGYAASICSREVSRNLIPRYATFPTVSVVTGPEFGLLSESGRRTIENAEFMVSRESNRMGFRLSGNPIETTGSCEMISSPVSFGTIQLLPEGQLVVLMADHQTSGGYPRVANVITRDLPIVAQLSAGDRVAFRFVEIEEAESLMMSFERDIAFLRVGCRLQGADQYQGHG